MGPRPVAGQGPRLGLRGSNGTKVEAICRFVEAGGRIGAIGGLLDAAEILRGHAGTIIRGHAAA